jgi:hypothetical protein
MLAFSLDSAQFYSASPGVCIFRVSFRLYPHYVCQTMQKCSRKRRWRWRSDPRQKKMNKILINSSSGKQQANNTEAESIDKIFRINSRRRRQDPRGKTISRMSSIMREGSTFWIGNKLEEMLFQLSPQLYWIVELVRQTPQKGTTTLTNFVKNKVRFAVCTHTWGRKSVTNRELLRERGCQPDMVDQYAEETWLRWNRRSNITCHTKQMPMIEWSLGELCAFRA